MSTMIKALWAARAWLDTGFAEGVLLTIDEQGQWQEIATNVPASAVPVGTEWCHGTVLPGLINAHSHAFQRSFVGQSECLVAGRDDFWSWRERMYQVALGISPAMLKDLAIKLYRELLLGGYTQVCEFHYLHHDVDGSAYEDELLMAWTLAEAAQEVGIGITLLPVLYERAGFAQTSLRPEQRRFRSDVAWVRAAARRLAQARLPGVNVGIAIHSLRAALPESISALVHDFDGPIHIHVAEQMAEVDECLRVTGLRPVDYLFSLQALDARWHLVHATHSNTDEIEQVARAGATAVLCPSTEANLGDGLCDLPQWLAAGARLAIGSDSHVTRDVFEELRLLEYGQRLWYRQRNIAAEPSLFAGSSAARLFARVGHYESGSAAGFARWGLQVGARADALLWSESISLDELVFSSPRPALARVMVAGKMRV